MSDKRVEDANYGSYTIRSFLGMDLTHKSAPGVPTLLRFRRLLEKHYLTRSICSEISGHLASKGIMMREMNLRRRPP